uniref:GPI transamidase subunit PIG-U n=2 Tax=Ditylum brightwellii TaxID=49249 RepID=A0A7S4RJG0_9STRA
MKSIQTEVNGNGANHDNQESKQPSSSTITQSREGKRNTTASSMTKTTKLWLVIFTSIRLFLVLNIGIPNGLSFYLNNTAWKSALVDPLYTLRHLREGQSLLNLYTITSSGGGTFDTAYTGRLFHLPPMILALFQPILFLESTYVQNVCFGLLLMMVDLAIAFCLYDIGCKVLVYVKHDDVFLWERDLEKKMHFTIHPKRAWLFGGTEFMSSSSSSEKEKQEGKNTEGQLEEMNEINTISSNKVSNKTPDPPAHDNQHKPKEDDIPDPIMSIHDLPQMCALVYYCNPIPILASCGNESFSFQNICYLFLLLALRESMFWKEDIFSVEECQNDKENNDSNNNGEIQKEQQQQSVVNCDGDDSKQIRGHASTAAFYLALASYMEIFPCVYIIPIALLLRSGVKNEQGKKQAMIACIAFFILWSICLQFLSASLVGSKNWPVVMMKTYGYSHGFVDSSPNLGLLWYFFIQTFGRFRLYYIIVFAGLPYIFISPICARLHRYPFEMSTAFAFLWVLHKPVPTIYDVFITFTLVLLSPRSVIRMGNACLVAVVSLIVPIVLFIMDYWMWLETGVGNANYMFFQCLAFNGFYATILLEFVVASLQRDKTLRLTEKETK